MEQSDRRSSIRDIWTLVAGGVTVFHYNVTLATWFFGLNLVRFDNTEGRSEFTNRRIEPPSYGAGNVAVLH